VYDNPAVSEIVRVPFDINETKNKVETRKLAEGFVRRSSRLELGSPARFMCFVYWCPQRQETKECIPGTQWISSFTLFQGDLDKNINFHSYLLDFAAVYKHDVQLSTPRPMSDTRLHVSEGHDCCEWTTPQPGKESLIPSVLKAGPGKCVLLLS
jgi:hypothetical protein